MPKHYLFFNPNYDNPFSIFIYIDGERVFLKMAPYKKDRFCILHIVEFKYWVRAWVTEADPSADPNQFIPVKITMPSPGFKKNVQV